MYAQVFIDVRDVVRRSFPEVVESPSFEDLSLSTRARNSLELIGISCVSDLVTVTRQTLLDTRNLGRGTADEIEATLANYGLELASEEFATYVQEFWRAYNRLIVRPDLNIEPPEELIKT